MSKAKEIKEQILDELNYYNNQEESYKRLGYNEAALMWSSKAGALELLMNHLEKKGLI